MGPQGDPCDDIQGVDDIAQGLAHLPAVGVPHHRVQVHLEGEGNSHVTRPEISQSEAARLHVLRRGHAHLLEGQLAGELEAHHDHAGHPEEQDVMARLQQGAGVEHIKVLGL